MGAQKVQKASPSKRGPQRTRHIPSQSPCWDDAEMDDKEFDEESDLKLPQGRRRKDYLSYSQYQIMDMLNDAEANQQAYEHKHGKAPRNRSIPYMTFSAGEATHYIRQLKHSHRFSQSPHLKQLNREMRAYKNRIAAWWSRKRKEDEADFAREQAATIKEALRLDVSVTDVAAAVIRKRDEMAQQIAALMRQNARLQGELRDLRRSSSPAWFPMRADCPMTPQSMQSKLPSFGPGPVRPTFSPGLSCDLTSPPGSRSTAETGCPQDMWAETFLDVSESPSPFGEARSVADEGLDWFGSQYVPATNSMAMSQGPGLGARLVSVDEDLADFFHCESAK